MKTLLTDDLADEFGGVTHDLVTKVNFSTTSPDVKSQTPFDFFIYKI